MNLTNSYRLLVSVYSTEKDTFCKLLTLAPPGVDQNTIKWEWVKEEKLQKDQSFSCLSQIIEYKDCQTQTDTNISLKLDQLHDLNVKIPVNPYNPFASLLPKFDGSDILSTLDPSAMQMNIDDINLENKTATISYQNSPYKRKQIDLYFLMTINPEGVATYLTTKH